MTRELVDYEGYKVHYIEHDSDVIESIERLKSLLYVGIDTETTGLDPKAKNVRLRLLQIGNEEFCYVFDIFKLNDYSKYLLKEFIQDNSRLKVFHNAKFDMKFLYVHLDECELLTKVFCTMIATQLTYCGLTSIPATLQYIVGTRLGVSISKEERLSDWSLGTLSDSQILYSATDVKYLLPLRRKIIEELVELNLVEVAKIEFDCLPAIVQKEVTGFKLDVNAWSSLVNLQRKRVQRYQVKISNALNPNAMLFDDIPSFNVGSPQQLKKFLKQNGIQIPKVRDKKTGEMKETISIDELEKHKHKHPLISKIIRHAQARKLYTSYGKNILSFVNPIDGRIRCNYKQVGPETGRLSCSEPNLQQIPASYRYRRCFIADDGYTLVSGDYSQIELRILAEFSKDENMIHAFSSGLDLHRYTASLVFGTTYENVNPVQRRKAKDLNFGMVYGIGVERFAESSKMSLEEAEEMMNNYFLAYPKLKLWLDNAGKFAVIKKYSLTMSRRRAVYHFDHDDKRAISLVRRNGSNMPIQGTSADITKIALPMVMNGIRGMGKVIHSVHDEIVTEVKLEFAQTCEAILTQKMIDAAGVYMKFVPVKVDTKISPYWKK